MRSWAGLGAGRAAPAARPRVPVFARVLLTALLCATSACRQESKPRSTTEGLADRSFGRNLIIISLDTLRADRLGCYGYDRPTSPTIDALAARGVRFASVVAESCWTLPSHMTLFTGLQPSTHGVTERSFRLSADVPLLTEVLHKHGYRCFGYTGGRYLEAAYGFGRGFEEYRDGPSDFPQVLQWSRERVQGLGSAEPYFLFIHTYAVHCPYDPPEPYAKMFRTRPPDDYLETAGRCGNPYYNQMELTPGQVRFLSDQYDAGIRCADDLLREFVAFLDSRGELANTILVVLSDHGEEFKEHGKIGHHANLFVECLMVPLVVVAPGLEPRVVTEPVRLADVMPTVLEMLRIPSPDVQGRSLVPLMLGRAADWAKRTMFSETRGLRSTMDGPHHFVLSLEPEQRMLFDLRTDPQEQRNLWQSDPRRAAELERRLIAYFAELKRHRVDHARQLTPEEIDRLRAIGYTE